MRKLRFKRERCALYKWFLVIFAYLFVFTGAVTPNREKTQDDLIIYPVIPFEGEMISSNQIFVDRIAKSVLQAWITAERSLLNERVARRNDGTGNDGTNDSGYDEGAIGESTVVSEFDTGDAVVDEGINSEVLTYLGNWTISFYCPCEICCGQWATGCTASGTLADPWHTCATDGLEFGTILYVDGLGYFEVLDRGTEYGWLDIYVGDHQEALNLGLQYRDVYIVE